MYFLTSNKFLLANVLFFTEMFVSELIVACYNPLVPEFCFPLIFEL